MMLVCTDGFVHVLLRLVDKHERLAYLTYRIR